MSKFTLVVDSSQISTFLECPQKWINQYVKRLEPVYFTENESMNSGTYGHKLLDIYYRARFRGETMNSAMQAGLDYKPDDDMCECGCIKDVHVPVPSLDIVECSRCKKCTSFRPKPFVLNSLVRAKVRNSLVNYFAKYEGGDIVPLSEQHVEVGFSKPIFEDADNLFVLEGRIDMIGKLQGLECWMDHKFQEKAHWLYLRSVQFKNYSLMSGLPGIINYIRLSKKVEPETYTREVISLNSVELQVWHKRLIQIYMRMKKTLLAAQSSSKDVIERNWAACKGDYQTFDKNQPKFCFYTALCEEIDPKMAEAKEKQLFKIKENPWRPW